MADTDGSARRMRIPLRIFLSLVIVAALMPPLVLLAMVVVRTAESDRAAAHTSLVDNAKVIASMVHGAIVSDAQVLGTIGGHVNEGPLEHANELELIGEHFRGDAVIVTSSPPTPSRPEWSVSNLVDIRPGERANLVFTVPLNEDTGDVLQVTADSTAVSSKISFGTLQNQMLVAVVDGNGNIITRSVAAAENLGKRVPSWEALLEVGASTGSFNAIAFDGTPISFGFSSIEGTPWRADRHGNVLEMEGWNEFTGQSTQAALGRGWVERVHPEDLPNLTQTLETAARAGIATATAEVRVRTDLYDWVWVNFRGAMITDAEGMPAEWIGTLENIDDRKRLQLRISHMAYHDALTGLPNRIRLAEHFEELWQPDNAGQSCALLYIDLDMFKQANDTYGHATGDALLREVAVRLQKVLRQNDVAARLGGDEFAVVLVALKNVDYSTTVASRIVKALSVPFEIDGHSVQIGASVGVAPFLAGGVSIERLQFEADSALYRAKSEGRNRWSFTSTSKDAQQRA